jgi:hypothetical protein
MPQIVKNYKILLDNRTTNADKNIIVNFGDMFQFHDYRDIIQLRSETYIDKLFEKENPVIDFEKYKFKPDIGLEGIDMYFYRKDYTTSNPISYDDSVLPVWAIDDPAYIMSSGFNINDVPNSTLFLDSYFKFEFLLDPTLQKTLFSITLPLDGTMLQPGTTSRPSVDFSGVTKTEIYHIFWLRKPQQLPSVIFTGNTFDLYCSVSFNNSKTGKVTNFRRDARPTVINNDDMLPGSDLLSLNYTMQDKYIMYRLDYSNFTYKILHIDGSPFLSNRIKLYAL